MNPKLSESRVRKYFDMAESAAHYSDNKRTRLGAVLVYKNKVLSVGWNLEDKTNPLQKQLNSLRGFSPDESGCKNTVHAEISCLLKIKDLDIDWSKVNLFVSRILKDDTKAMARPCPACMAYARSLGIKNYYYTTGKDAWAYERVVGND